MGNSQMLLRAPSVKASEGVLADLALATRVAARRRGMKSSVSLVWGCLK